MSSFKDIIKNAKDQNTSNTESQNSGASKFSDEATQPEEKVANLTIKVPLALRQHWAGEAKKQGTSLTSVIIEALTERFGKP
jgi:predicted HicB family RNase H-like nuclease